MARPVVITNIRTGDPDGNVWDLNILANDAFFALNDGSPAFDDAVAKLNLETTDLTVTDLDAYGYVFLGTNQADTVTGLANATGIIATGNGSDDVTSGALDHVIFAGNGMDTARGGGGNDIIYGENGQDQLAGNMGNDDVRGGNGKDCLHGNDGDDKLVGGNGADVLSGGAGADELVGRNGDDQFHWHAVTEFGDTVVDFTAGSDTLVFHVGADDPEISVGNDDAVVENFVTGDDTAINVADTEVAVKTDAGVATADIQTTIDGYSNISTGALFAFLDETEGHAVLYYDADPSTAGEAALVAEFSNITTLDQLSALTAGDFMFV